MKADAEKYAEEDKQKKESIEVRNQVETGIYQIEKMLEDNKDKIPEAETKETNDLISSTKKELENKSLDVTKLKELSKALMDHSQKLVPFTQTQEEPQAESQDDVQSDKPKDKDVVDAEFEVVDDDNKK